MVRRDMFDFLSQIFRRGNSRRFGNEKPSRPCRKANAGVGCSTAGYWRDRWGRRWRDAGPQCPLVRSGC